jgi:hypothetical protein
MTENQNDYLKNDYLKKERPPRGSGVVALWASQSLSATRYIRICRQTAGLDIVETND